MSVTPGMIGFVGTRKPGFLQKAVMFFARSKWSHCFFITFPHGGDEAVQEASWSVQIIPFQRYRDDPDGYYEIFELTKADPRKLEQSVMSQWKNMTGVKYNWFGLVWFIWRWMNELVGRDIRHEKNWFSDGVICSQTLYYEIEGAGAPYGGLLMDETPWTVQPQDIYNEVMKRPELFAMREHKD